MKTSHRTPHDGPESGQTHASLPAQLIAVASAVTLALVLAQPPSVAGHATHSAGAAWNGPIDRCVQLLNDPVELVLCAFHRTSEGAVPSWTR